MAEHKLPILKMESTRISLEDIFLELTEEGNEVVQEDSSEAASEEAEQAAEETEGQEEIDHDSDI
ncbi:bacitracin transport ATP-binding protein BcrA [Firmicutes bacterium CAG:646]|nr:bacitracin transport ATP-binding protein BcrA [Firmicutes bacterium CAG:646]